ncbi:MAG: hypothetical protein ACOCVU_02105 [Desulfohalobiaceae bacterium]
MSLNERLAEIKKSFQEDQSIDQDVKQATADFAAHLKALGLEKAATQKGDVMPAFNLPAAGGGSVSLSEVLDSGPAVVVFFRGKW